MALLPLGLLQSTPTAQPRRPVWPSHHGDGRREPSPAQGPEGPSSEPAVGLQLLQCGPGAQKVPWRDPRANASTGNPQDPQVSGVSWAAGTQWGCQDPGSPLSHSGGPSSKPG